MGQFKEHYDFTNLPQFSMVPKGHQRTDGNYFHFPKIFMKLNEESVSTYNKQVEYFESVGMPKIIRTPKCGVSLRSIGWAYDSRRIGNAGFELTVTSWFSTYRLRLTGTVDDKDEASKLTGREAFVIMRRQFQKDGVDLNDYTVEDGKRIKEEEIEPPMIKLGETAVPNKIYTNVHHLDFHSSYPGGLARLHPEMKPTLERIYEKRKNGGKDSELKLALDASIGFFQSRYCNMNGHGYCLANLARDAINDNNARIRQVERELIESGRTPLLYNTDGIWYQGEPLESGRDHGKQIGMWENDHKDCTIRIKSRGCYEYMEMGKYHPVVRGTTLLDRKKSRDQWSWGDIYKNGGVLLVGMKDDGTLETKYTEEDI